MRIIRRGGLRTFLSGLLVCSTVLLTRPACAQDPGTSREAPAAPATTLVFTQTPVPLTDSLSSILAKVLFGPYAIFSDYGVDSLDVWKDFYDTDPIGLKLQTKVFPQDHFAAFDGHPTSNGGGFVGTVMGLPEYRRYNLDRLFVGKTKTVDLTRIFLTGVDASQGLSVVGDYFGNFVIVSFRDQAAYVHFAFMTVGQFLRQTLPGIPVHALWTQAGVSVLFRNPNGLIFIPKQGTPSIRTFPFTPNKIAYSPSGHYLISDGVLPVIHELMPDFTEVAQYPVHGPAYALTFLTAQLLLFVLLPNVLGLLDLTTRVETDYTLQGSNRQILDYFPRPGYFPPRILVDSFDTVLRKGLVDQVTISGVDFDPHHAVLPRLRHDPYIQWAP